MMANIENPAIDTGPLKSWPRRIRDCCFWLFVGVLAWAPFPLGSNREWSWSVLTLCVTGCWLLWAMWAISNPAAQWENFKRVALPLFLVTLTIVWAEIQTLPVVPANWVHPMWVIMGNVLDRQAAAVISLNPWRTLSEAEKLLTEVCVAWLAFSLARNGDRARYLLNAIIFIGAAYAFYGFVLGIIGTSQYALYYSAPVLPPGLPSGPFVLHNSFATFEGLATLAALSRLVELGDQHILTTKGTRRWTLSMIQFAFGSGAPIIIATILTISALAASASRGGAFATLCGLVAMAILAVLFAKRGQRRGWALGGVVAMIALVGILFWISGNTLSARAQDLIDAGNAEPLRLALWDAALRMIASAPLFGLGLGTFQDAYPMYATQIFPYIMDKAHCDYLEFAAGLGLPAACCWWAAMALAMVIMLKGVFARRKDKIYPLVGVGAMVLVGVHSAVDFSLQIPAVAVLYASLLGLGLAQSHSSQKASR